MTGQRDIVTAISVSRPAGADAIDTITPLDHSVAVERLIERTGVTEAFVLQTCDRVEGYVAANSVDAGQRALASLTEPLDESAVQTYRRNEVTRHLFRVSAGLESRVLGEDQILGQLKDAYQDAREMDGMGTILGKAVNKALRVGKRVRTETAINDGPVSLAGAAMQLVEENHQFDSPTGLVVGAGEMGALAADVLDGCTTELLVVNRTLARAEQVASAVETQAYPLALEELDSALSRADIVMSATGSETPIVESEQFRTVGETVVVDTAQPRDIPLAAADYRHVELYDLDHLEQLRERTRRQRQGAIDSVEATIDRELDRLETAYERKRADDVISTIHTQADQLKDQQLQRALGALDLDEGDEAVLEAMTESLVGKLLAPATESLRDAAEDGDHDTLETALALFGPADGEFPDHADSGESTGTERPDSAQAVLGQSSHE